jgi:hypothetical protein
MTRWFILPRFGSKEPSPRWGGHKDWASFNPFPLLNGHLDRVSFLLNSHGSLRPRKDHHTIGVSFLAYKALGNKNEEGRKRSKKQERKEHKQTLSQVTRWVEWILDLERLWFYWIVSRSECTSSCIEWNVWKTWMLGVVVVGGIYSPQPPHSRWKGCMPKGASDSLVRHRTLLGAPATSPNH